MAESPNDGNSMKIMLRCTDFAAKKHATQRRKDAEQTPYINHPIGVANILANEGNITDINVIAAALLHDTVEDTDTSLDEIEKHFGSTIRGIVDEVTDDKSLRKAERKRAQVIHARTASREAKLVKLADKLYNLRDLNRSMPVGWTPERVQEYFMWAAEAALLHDTVEDTDTTLEEIEKHFGSSIRGIVDEVQVTDDKSLHWRN